MRILVFAAYPIFARLFETELEIIQTHLDVGDQVIVLGCNAAMLSCDPNPWHEVHRCLTCTGTRRAGLKLLSGKLTVKPVYFLTPENKREIGKLRSTFSTLRELKKFRVENFDIGYGVASSLISEIAGRDPKPDLAEYGEVVSRYMMSALGVYRSIQNYLSLYQIDRAYVSCGRLGHERAVLRACQSKGVECVVPEICCSLDHYALYRNVMAHDIEYVQRLVRETWDSADSVQTREEVGRRFFMDNSKGAVPWMSMAKDQQDGLLPANWDRRKENIVIFSSSEDELAAVDEGWENPLYEDQLDGLKKILNSLSVARCDDMHLYLRMHPNLKKVENQYTRELLGLRADFLTIVAPDDPVSTYALIKEADKVVTFGSTVGIEAVFWGKPSILAGPSFYRELGGTYNPSSHEELIELLKIDLEPKDRKGALMYGYFMKTFGVPFKYYKSWGLWEGEFRGKEIKRGRWISLMAGAQRRARKVRGVVNRISRMMARKGLTGRFRK